MVVKDDEDVVFKTESELESTPYQIPITPTAADFEQPESVRVEVHTYRILRDTKLARTLKSSASRCMSNLRASDFRS